MKKIIVLLVLSIFMLEYRPAIAETSSSIMLKSFESVGVMSYRLKKEVEKEPEAGMEASMIISAVTGGIVDYVTRDPDSPQYAEAEKLPCPFFGNYFYAKKDDDIQLACKKLRYSPEECTRFTKAYNHMKKLSCRMTDSGIAFEGISEPVNQILERVMADQVISYHQGSFYFQPHIGKFEKSQSEYTESGDTFFATVNGESVPLKKVAEHVYSYQFPKNNWRMEFIEENGVLVKQLDYFKDIKMWERTLEDGKANGVAIAYYPDGSGDILAEVVLEEDKLVSGSCPIYNNSGHITGKTKLSSKAIDYYNKNGQLNCDM